MPRNLLHALSAMAAAVALLIACSSDPEPEPTCSNKTGKCPADPVRDEDEMAKCTQSLKDAKCGAQFRAFEDCTQTKASCDSNGKTDGKALLTSTCKNEYCAYAKCTSSVVPAFCTGTGGTTDAGTGASDAKSSG
jgi:hypothetical protein